MPFVEAAPPLTRAPPRSGNGPPDADLSPQEEMLAALDMAGEAGVVATASAVDVEGTTYRPSRTDR
eukprot:COSAG05_NODE_694_length_7891_cov_5.305570_5_plen_66_part_00